MNLHHPSAASNRPLAHPECSDSTRIRIRSDSTVAFGRVGRVVSERSCRIDRFRIQHGFKSVRIQHGFEAVRTQQVFDTTRRPIEPPVLCGPTPTWRSVARAAQRKKELGPWVLHPPPPRRFRVTVMLGRPHRREQTASPKRPRAEQALLPCALCGRPVEGNLSRRV